MTEPQAQKRGLLMQFPEFDAPIFVQGDQTRLKQVLINLITNAIKYNREHGMVEVVYAEISPKRARISIKDQGKGLSPEQLLQLFQPFVRLEQSAGPEEGTGIGLVVTKQLVELMGGIVGVESVVGEGSTFWFELDISTPADIASVQAGSPPDVNAQSTLLYIEANPANLLVVKKIIDKRSDVALLTARDGDSGVELARAGRADVILLDINQSDINCFEILKILRVDPVLKRIPVIVMTPYTVPREIEKGVKSGFLLYITKPVRERELIGALNKALEFAAQETRSADDTLQPLSPPGREVV